jgi:hypothetical protein
LYDQPDPFGPRYIKELADRIHHIEGKLGGAVEGLDAAARRESVDPYPSTIPADELSRKRPFSSISVDAIAPGPNRHAAWATEHRPIQPYQIPTLRPEYSVNGLAPRPIGLKADGSVAPRPAAMMGGQQREKVPNEQLPDLDDGLFHR